MAAQILFKISCPSCEAQVPIREESRIGKKVECPKCKFRFVVEDPGMGEIDDDVAAPVKTKAPAKKKSNSTLLIGGGVAAVAVLVLAVVGYFLMFTGDDSSAKPIAKASPIVKTMPPKAEIGAAPESAPAEKTTESAKVEEKSTGVPKTETPATPTVVQSDQSIPAGGKTGEITNMLPNNSMSVAVINMDKLRFSTLGEQLFESKVGFRPGAFKEKLGIAIEDMVKYVRGENPEQKWSFNIIRTAKKIEIKDLEKALQFKKGAKSPIKGRTYYELPPNDLLDNLATALKAESELRKDKDKKEEPSSPLGLAIIDETTVVIATIEPLEQFLTDDIKPLQKSKAGKGANDAEGNANPGAGEGPAKPRGRDMRLNYSTMSMQQPAGGDEDPNAAGANFLTIEPELKAMFDRLERDLKSPPIAMAAARVKADPSIIKRIQALPALGFLPDRTMKVFGLVLTKYELERFYATIMIEFFSEPDVQEIEKQLKKLLPGLGQALGIFLKGIKVETEGGDAQASGGGGGGGRGAPPGGGGRGAPPGGGEQLPGAVIPGIGTETEGPVSKLKLSRKARYLILEGEMNLPQRAHDKIYEMTKSVVTRMRGMVEMASSSPLWKEWSIGLVKLYEEKGEIPRGTYQLKEGIGGRMARNWPPSHRVSWMAAVLPQLGKDDIFRAIQKDTPWRDQRNLDAGAQLVPEFLDPRYPGPTWYAHLESLGSKVVAATHYVGIAGVGVEAGDYKSNDPAVAKKLGVFGYERPLNINDVADGKSNTIMVAQVPANYQRPWIAGGGATVVGVPEQRSVRPFVNKHGDKRGTYVVMLDGSVRFIAENISDEVFKALCTIKGGEAIDDLDKIAPKAKHGTAEMKTTAKAE